MNPITDLCERFDDAGRKCVLAQDAWANSTKNADRSDDSSSPFGAPLRLKQEAEATLSRLGAELAAVVRQRRDGRAPVAVELP